MLSLFWRLRLVEEMSLDCPMRGREIEENQSAKITRGLVIQSLNLRGRVRPPVSKRSLADASVPLLARNLSGSVRTEDCAARFVRQRLNA
jgi:hypothetical protein